MSNIGRFTNLDESDLRLTDGRSWRRGLPAKNRIDLTGEKFGSLMVVGYGHTKGKTSYWKVKCECGKEYESSTQTLRGGAARSCGCSKWTQNRLSNTTTYRSWRAMVIRCSDPKHQAYKFYGGRGIHVCERWMNYLNFVADMGMRPEGTSIDRYPNKDGNYEPKNCRWATKREQMRNTRNNHFLTIGMKTLTISEWAEETGVKMGTIWERAKSGRSPEECIFAGNLPYRRLSC